MWTRMVADVVHALFVVCASLKYVNQALLYTQLKNYIEFDDA